jgi:hypothetical protein
MKNNRHYIEEFVNNFKNHSSFTCLDAQVFYQKYFPDINMIAVNTRISRLTANGIISRVGRGLYKMGSKKLFKPLIDVKLKLIYKQIQNQFPSIQFCIWHTSWFSQFMDHQPATYYTIIETESDNELRTRYSQSVFDFLKVQHKTTFHNPDIKTIQNYVSDSRNSIVVIPMISEAPIQKLEKITTATLEKMLVDIYCDEPLFAAQQGIERMNIFREAYERYTINTSKLLRYAARRKKRQEIENYLKTLNINDR